MWHDMRSLGRSPRFRRLFIARFVSNVGNGMSPVALAFGVLSIPGAGATALSLVTAAQLVPIALLLLAGGVVADRVDRARLVGIVDIIGAVTVACSGALLITHSATVLLLCITSAAFGVLNALWYPAFSGLMPVVVERDRLQAANSLVGLASNVGFTIGAAVAAGVVSTAGPGWALVVDACSFLVAGVLTLSIANDREMADDEPARGHSMLAELREGWREFTAHRWLTVGVIASALTNLCITGFFAVLAPLATKEHFHGARSFGVLMAAWGAGSIGGVLVSMRVRPRRPVLVGVALLPVLGVLMVAFAVPLAFVALVLLMVAAGVALEVFVVLWNTTVQRLVPTEALSRVSAYDALGWTVCAPIGLFVAGPLAVAVGTGTALVLMGAVTIAAPLVALLSADVRAVRGPVA